MTLRGWDRCDFVLVTGDAYVDHPSFGAAVIGRVLEAGGYRVGIIPQPDWNDPESVRILGKPALAFLLTSGNMDSMVSRYTSARKLRSEDAFSPGGQPGRRPDRALLVYTSLVRRAYKGVPVIIGGIEASLRRFVHYDYWSDKLRRPILLDSKADLLVYGMGETPILQVARELARGVPAGVIRDVRGTCWRGSAGEAELPEGEILPDYQACQGDPGEFVRAFKICHGNTNPHSARPLLQEASGMISVQNPPAFPLEGRELDRVYELPYTRRAHPMYDRPGEEYPVPALKEVEFSLASSRGCFGSCSFCALTFHQGRIVTARTEDSLAAEGEALTRRPGFKGYIHDLGGPTANFFHSACAKQARQGGCPDRECLYPRPCPAINGDHSGYIRVLRRLRELPGVKKVFIRSGIRYDYLETDRSDAFLEELTAHHVSGQLKVAPEHASPEVLELMGKPPIEVFTRFSRRFAEMNRKLGKNQYIIPYFISGHPGSTLKDAVLLAEYLRDSGFVPDQVQDFYPTPGTRSTCMYYAGIDPLTGKKVYVPREGREKTLQRALLHFHKPENAPLVREALIKAGRRDLIGRSPRALVGPEGSGGPVKRLRHPGGPAGSSGETGRAGSGRESRPGSGKGSGRTSGKRRNPPEKGRR